MAVKQESLVQAAIMASLEVYGDRNAVHTDVFAPYANQQGYAGGKYPGDIIGLLDGARILLLEVKELDYLTPIAPVLHQFNLGQFLQYYWLEQSGVPILYAYAARDEMPYFLFPRRREWPYATLNRTRVSPPGELMDSLANFIAKRPAIETHGNLLDWLLNVSVASSASVLMLLGFLGSSASALKASILIVQTAAGGLTALPAAAVRAALRNVLSKEQTGEVALDDEHQRKVDEVRQAIEDHRVRHKARMDDLDQRVDVRAEELVDEEIAVSGRELADEELEEVRMRARKEVESEILEEIAARQRTSRPTAAVRRGYNRRA
ncbi:hypothetical protein [Stenotrophomonas sp.]|uniref:hypothetical protein n=1 Tax=Stenotrophomonas sp. TaxID=69392 RepID=UPI0028A88903|nr:hypothetical protein [Stenotrophomonas sp.]